MAAAVLGLEVDVPNSTISLAPLVGSGIERLTWSGLALAGRTMDLHLEAGQVTPTYGVGLPPLTFKVSPTT